MILLILFAFLAGIVTVLSPCILPILPIILSSTMGGVSTGKSRPLGVVVGFILSFTFFTLFLSTVVKLSGISADSLRTVSVVVIAVFGVSLIVPQFQLLIEKLFSRFARLAPNSQSRSGFFGGLLIGLSVGLLWTPCVGPILASVISLAITGTITFDALLITLAYSFGTAIPMFLIILGGQNALKRVPWLLANTSRVQKVFGVLMILTALGIYNNVDRKFQTYVLNTFPQYGAGLTRFEDNQEIKKQLETLNDRQINTQGIGKPMFEISGLKGPLAPELIPGGIWFNSEPLTLKNLRGKVVIIDFWTYSCINCQRTMPYLRKWWGTYKDKGLVIIGVHSPEFEFEKSVKNVTQAIKDFKLPYPVVQDNDFATWRAYNNRYWPAKYILDKEGFIRYTHFGEGAYDETEKVIQDLLKEAGAKDVSSQINNPTYEVQTKTPEIYLGYDRIEGFASLEPIVQNSFSIYTLPKMLESNKVAIAGSWKISEEYANPKKGASLLLNFESKEVYLVMRTIGQPAKLRVFIDDEMQYYGEDNNQGTVTVDSDTLYRLIKLPTPGGHILRLEFDDDNAELYAFTFG